MIRHWLLEHGNARRVNRLLDTPLRVLSTSASAAIGVLMAMAAGIGGGTAGAADQHVFDLEFAQVQVQVTDGQAKDNAVYFVQTSGQTTRCYVLIPHEFQNGEVADDREYKISVAFAAKDGWHIFGGAPATEQDLPYSAGDGAADPEFRQGNSAILGAATRVFDVGAGGSGQDPESPAARTVEVIAFTPGLAMVAHTPASHGAAGEEIERPAAGLQETPYGGFLFKNIDFDLEREPGGEGDPGWDWGREPLDPTGSADDDFVQIDLRFNARESIADAGTVRLQLPDDVRAFDEDGLELQEIDLEIDLAEPNGPLADLVDGLPVQIWLEGGPEWEVGDVILSYDLTGGEGGNTGTVADAVMLVTPVIAVDSNNDDGIDLPNLDEAEFAAMGVEGELEFPGKILLVANGDLDGDNVPDFADGMEGLGAIDNDGLSPGPEDEDDRMQAAALTPMLISIPDYPGLDTPTSFRLVYEASDPSEIVRSENPDGTRAYAPGAGELRVWTRNTSDTRDALPVDEGGDFIPSDLELTLDDLPESVPDHPDVPGESWRVLYVESVRASEQPADQRVKLEILAPGTENEWLPVHEAAFTSLQFELAALDENGDPLPGGVTAPILSQPSPVIELATYEIVETDFVPGQTHGDDPTLTIALHLVGQVTSETCDAYPAPGGVIEEIELWFPDAEQPIVIPLQVNKDFNADSIGKRYPYVGTFDTVIHDIEAFDGVNLGSLRARDPVFETYGETVLAWHIETPESWYPDPDEGGDPDPGDPGDPGDPQEPPTNVYEGQSLALAVQMNGDLSDAVVDTVSARLITDLADTGFVTLTETAADSGMFASADGQFELLLPVETSMHPGLIDSMQAVVTHLGHGVGLVYFNAIVETGSNTELFTRVVSFYSPQDAPTDDPMTIDDPEVIYQSDGGEFHGYTYRVAGPDDLVTGLESLELVPMEQPGDVSGGGVAEVGFQLTVDMVAHQQEYYLEQVLAARAARELEDWDEDDESEEAILGALERQAGAWMPGSALDFTQGFGAGFFDGGKYLVQGTGDLISLGRKGASFAIKSTWRGMTYPYRLTGKVLNGYRFEQERQMVHNVVQGSRAAAQFAADLAAGGADLILDLLTGRTERFARMGGEIREVMLTGAELFIGLFDTYQNATDYRKGYYVGRGAFEVSLCFVPFSKLAHLRNLGKGEKLDGLRQHSRFFSSGPGKAAMDNLQPLAAAAKTTGLCFVAGTLVWSATLADTSAAVAAEGDGTFFRDGVVIERILRPIEDIAVGDLVWARCESTGEEAWKPVVDTIVTRPLELWTLEFELTGDGNGAHDPAAISGGGLTDTITGTAVHPFHVVGAAEFVSMADLQPGDLLLLADGRGLARVLGLRPSRAPPGERFTTYNFEVEDFHTYFVGEAGVWVHNNGPACHQVKSAFFRTAANTGLSGPALRAQRFEILVQAKGGMRPSQVIDSATWAGSARHVSASMVDDFATGVIANVDDLPKVADWNNRFFRGAGTRVGKVDTDVHHMIPKKVRTDMQGAWPAGFGPDDVPGHAMSRGVHQDLTAEMNTWFNSPAYDALQPGQKAQGLVDLYEGAGYVAQAKVVKAWFQARGVLP